MYVLSSLPQITKLLTEGVVYKNPYQQSVRGGSPKSTTCRCIELVIFRHVEQNGTEDFPLSIWRVNKEKPTYYYLLYRG